MQALAMRMLEPPTPREEWLSVALPRPASRCYALFCDVDRTAEWLRIIRFAVVTERDLGGRPRRAAFLARLRRAAVGYNLEYRYLPRLHHVSFQSLRDSSIDINGFARFQPLGEASCLMTYALRAKVGHALPEWDDTQFTCHQTSTTMADFRDFVLRQ